MENIDIDLRFSDNGYGITCFEQKAAWGGGEVSFTVRGLNADEKQKADEIVGRAWSWACDNVEQVKDFLSAELGKDFEERRKNKERNVPPDDAAAIRAQLAGLNINSATFYPGQNAFELNFPGTFNGYKYRIYVSVNYDELTLKKAGILTMGGFKPPLDEPKTDLKKAAALYEYHLNHGGEKELYKHYIALPKKEIAAFIDLFIADEDTELEERADLALYLALFAYACGETLPDELYRYLIDNEVFYPGEIYLRADDKFADELIALLAEVDAAEAYRLTVSHILCALAMIPSRRVNDFFIENSAAPLPIWAEKLHLLPTGYAHVGGWETSEQGEPQMLFSQDITAFERCEKKEASPLAPLHSLPERCGFCGQPLTLVFSGERELATCLHCSCYQTVFTKIADSEVRWHKANAPGSFFEKHPEFMENSEDIAARFKNGLRPTKEKRRASYTANEFAQISRTQIGGMPTAVNDVDYPVCPDCNKTMRFAAQFDMFDIEDGEGIYYFFACDSCKTAGANYDQS